MHKSFENLFEETLQIICYMLTILWYGHPCAREAVHAELTFQNLMCVVRCWQSKRAQAHALHS